MAVRDKDCCLQASVSVATPSPVLPSDIVYANNISDARSYEGRAVRLHSVIRKSKLAIMLNCAGDQLLQDYVYTARKTDTYPDVLIYNGRTIPMYTVEIYMVLLVNILDSQMNSLGCRMITTGLPRHVPRASCINTCALQSSGYLRL